MFEAFFPPPVRSAYDSLPDPDKADIDRIVGLLELNPWGDDMIKYALTLGRQTAGIYDDGRWEVVYRVVDDRFIEILGFSRIPS